MSTPPRPGFGRQLLTALARTSPTLPPLSEQSRRMARIFLTVIAVIHVGVTLAAVVISAVTGDWPPLWFFAVYIAVSVAIWILLPPLVRAALR